MAALEGYREARHTNSTPASIEDGFGRIRGFRMQQLEDVEPGLRIEFESRPLLARQGLVHVLVIVSSDIRLIQHSCRVRQ